MVLFSIGLIFSDLYQVFVHFLPCSYLSLSAPTGMQVPAETWSTLITAVSLVCWTMSIRKCYKQTLAELVNGWIHGWIRLSKINIGFPGGSDGKESACNAGDPSSILGQEDPLETGMATLSSILAWRILWTEEPGGRWPMGLQRVRPDWATNIHFHFQDQHKSVGVHDTGVWYRGLLYC